MLVVRSTQVLEEQIKAASPDLYMVLKSGAGYDNIDTSAASERSVYVANCMGKNSHAVAELTMAMMLAADRRISDCDNLLK